MYTMLYWIYYSACIVCHAVIDPLMAAHLFLFYFISLQLIFINHVMVHYLD